MNKLAIMTAMGLAAVAAFGASPLEDLAKRQARSVHLVYSPGERNLTSIKGTVTVTETQTNTYFCLFGWDCGYCGIQDKGEQGKVLIFSVWDPVDPTDYTARPENVKEEIRAKVLYANPEADVARFGGEGTGARTMTPFDWQVGEPVSMRVDAAPDGTNRTAYTCSYKNPANGEWTKLATLSTLCYPGHAQGLDGIYSFVEDFARNYKSAKLSRRAEFSHIAYKKSVPSEWRPITRAMFSADMTPSNTIDAGRTETGSFFLKTGGDTVNSHTRLWCLVD